MEKGTAIGRDGTENSSVSLMEDKLRVVLHEFEIPGDPSEDNTCADKKCPRPLWVPEKQVVLEQYVATSHDLDSNNITERFEGDAGDVRGEAP